MLLARIDGSRVACALSCRGAQVAETANKIAPYAGRLRARRAKAPAVGGRSSVTPQRSLSPLVTASFSPCANVLGISKGIDRREAEGEELPEGPYLTSFWPRWRG
ncbi:MAG: hypothetical protein JWM85_2605 [Acidimicrobiaceae bacterium]|nr:hypothetical protein [Acidimicrobiaceae bacterium]